MEQSKYKELFGMIKGTQAALESKIQKQERIINSMMVVIKDYDSQVQVLKSMLFSQSILDKVEYETSVDMRRGLRIKSETELVEHGDVAWVDYHAETDNNETKKVEVVGFENGMPIRVGSGAVAFEEALVGKKLGDTVQHIEKIKEEGPLKGKEVRFNIIIRRIKTKLKVKEVEDGQGGDAGDGQPGADEPKAEPSVGLEGRGHQPDGHSEPVTIQ